jgi:hypothetical protein
VQSYEAPGERGLIQINQRVGLDLHQQLRGTALPEPGGSTILRK